MFMKMLLIFISVYTIQVTSFAIYFQKYSRHPPFPKNIEDQSHHMVIGLYVHSKTNRHSAEAAPGWLHPLTCDHGVGGRTQRSACTWVCRGACWPLSSAYQLTHCATLIEIAAELQTMSTLSTASVFQVMHMFLKHCITHLHLKHLAFKSSGGQCEFILTSFPHVKSQFDCRTGNTM